MQVTTAPSWRRGLAGVVDVALCAVAWALLVWLTWPGDLPELPWNWLDTYVDWFNAQPTVLFVPMAWVLVVGFGYNLAFNLRGQETPGKRLLKLRTINADGEFPAPRHAAGYASLRALSTVPLLAGHLWALADPARRTLHDRLGRIWIICPTPATRPVPETSPGDAITA